MIFRNKAFLSACFLIGTAYGSAALAQAIPQDPVSRAATEVQEEAARGQISQKEAGAREGQLWKMRSEEQQDMARHGGYLTPQDNQKLWSQIHSEQGNNNFDGNKWNSGPRHGGIMHNYNNANQNGYPNGGYPGGPNGGGYGQYQNANAYNGNYPGNGYNGGYNGNGYNNNGYNNNGNSSGGSKFSQAASVLQGLLHH